MKLKVKTNINNYSVIVGKNLCSRINKIALDERIYSQKFLLVYDSKVPTRMIKSIVTRFNKKIIDKKKIVFNEKSKNLKTVSSIVKILEMKTICVVVFVLQYLLLFQFLSKQIPFRTVTSVFLLRDR